MPSEANVPSPCTGVCVLDARSGFCTGCGRSMEEIIAWPEMPDDEKRRVLERLQKSLRGGNNK